ncbi:MAG TPA: hypothetical protein VGL13_05715, partial [Polyangiaceae bacterium]
MRSTVGVALLAVGLAATTAVLAQGKKTARGRTNAPLAPAATAPASAPPAASSSAAPEPAKTPAVLPGKVEIGDGGARSSPLNPEPEEFPDAGAANSVPGDVDHILSDIASLRARVAAIGDTLFKSRITVRVEARGSHAKIGKLSISLDDGVVYTAPPGLELSDETTVYDHAVAPGRHVLSVEVERRDDRGEGFGTGQRSRFALKVP